MSAVGFGEVNWKGGYAVESDVPLPVKDRDVALAEDVIDQDIKAQYELFLDGLMVNQSVVLPEEARRGIRDSENFVTEVLAGGAVRVWRIK